MTPIFGTPGGQRTASSHVGVALLAALVAAACACGAGAVETRDVRPNAQGAAQGVHDSPSTAADAPVGSVGDGLCRVPTTFPRGLNGIELGAPLSSAIPDRTPAEWAEPGDFCLFEKPSVWGAHGVVHTIAFHIQCEGEHTFVACDDTAEFARRIGRALGVEVAAPGTALRATTEVLPWADGPYVLRAGDLELHIDPNVGYEGVDIVEVSLIAKTPQSVCHDDDGFRLFYAGFLDAVRAQQRGRVLDYFEFPFEDQVHSDTPPKPTALQRANFPFEKFFTYSAASGERRMPTAAHCQLGRGYIDPFWMQGVMVAEKGVRGWRWSRLMYIP